MLTQVDYSRLIWFSTLKDIHKILFYIPILGLSAKPKFSGTDVKQRETAFRA